MKTRITPDNPGGHTRSGYAWAKVPAGSECHLDLGCHEGSVLDALRTKGIARLVGVDLSAEAIRQGRRRFPHLELLHCNPSIPLPFADATFSSITLLDVLEHVFDQKSLFDELHRVLRDDGVLIVTVPRQHVFSFLDLGNLKFRFPRLHRWFYRQRHTREQYEHRYVSNAEGLIGDIDARKRWHEHFTPQRLADLLRASRFEPTEFDGSGLFTRPIAFLSLLIGWVRPLQRLLAALERADARCFQSMNLFCVARKVPPHR